MIGGGPAGLSAAYQLALKGHAVTIFDERAELGGMMRYGIPGFRTPREVLDAEIQRILDLGVQARMNCRIGSDVTMAQIRADFDAVFLGLGAQAGRALPVEGADAPNCVTATAFLKAFNDGRLRHVGKRVVVVGGGDTSIDVATVSRRLGHIEKINPSDRPEHAIAGYVAHDVAEVSAKQGAEVTLTSIFAVDKMQASRHEVEQAQAEGIAIRGGLAPVCVVRSPDGRAVALRVIRCEAKIVGGRLEIKNIEGTEEDIPADLIVSAIGQAVDFTGLDEFNNGKGGINADRNYQVQGQARHVRRRRRGAPAPADHGHRPRRDRGRRHRALPAQRAAGQAAEDRRAQLRPAAQDDREGPGLQRSARADPRHRQLSTAAIHNFDNRSDRYVIPHEELFLGHFDYTPRGTAQGGHAGRGAGARQLRGARAAADRSGSHRRGQALHELRPVLRMRQLRRLLPADGRVQGAKSKSTIGRYVDTDYAKCIGCHICKDVCPTGYIQMGLGE